MGTSEMYAVPFLSWLWKTTLQGSLLVCFILLVRLLLQDRLGPKWHFGLWLILLIRLTLPWSPQSPWSLYSLFQPSYWSHLASRPGTDMATVSSQSQQPSVAPTTGQSNSQTTSDASTKDQAPQLVRTPASPQPVREKKPSVKSHRTGSQFAVGRLILPILWLTGALMLGSHVLLRSLRLWWAISATHQAANSSECTASPRPRPKKTKGTTLKTKTGCGSLYVTVNQDERGLFEIFTNLGKAGGCPSQSEATARVLSVALRSGVPPEVLIEQLKGIRCLSTIARRKDNREIDVLSCPDAMARAIEAAMGHEYEPVIVHAANACPDCKYPLRREAGCNVCDNCGYSKCG